MNLVFYECVVPAEAKSKHGLAGGEDLTMHNATLHDGMLRVFSGREPISFEAAAMLKHHVSISVGPKQGPPRRRPTDEECQQALSLWSLVDFEEDNEGGASSMVRNFWEK